MRTLRRVSALVLALVIVTSLLIICSCEPTERGDIEFEDSLGSRVVLDGVPKRCAVLFSSLSEMWLISGGEVSISVKESVERGFCDAEVPLVHSDAGGAGKTINVELLIAEKPDFVICTADYSGQIQLRSVLLSAGIPVAYFRIDSFSDYLATLKIMTEINGNTDAYERYGVSVDNKIKSLLSNLPECEKRILFARATRTSLKAKLPEEHFAAAMLSELGAYNIASDAKMLIDGISVEALIAEQPDFIFISVMGDSEGAEKYINELFARPEWQAVDAVKSHRYVILSKELFQYKPCAHWYEAYRALYEYLYE